MRMIPKLFNPAMVAALLDGTKTETRRDNFQIKGYRGFFQFGVSDTIGHDWTFRRKDHVWEDFTHDELMARMPTQIGDLLWVKETHYAYGYWRTIPDVFTKKTGKPKREFVRYPAEAVLFEAPANLIKGKPEKEVGWYYRVSIHMPKADSRLTLRVTSYGIERLQDIDEAGAIAEGIHRNPMAPNYAKERGCDWTYGKETRVGSPVSAYASLWDSINGDGAWDANPWVDITKFEVIRRNVLEVAA